MFSSQSLQAVVRPGELAVRELRLDAAVRLLDVRGTLDATTAGGLARRIDAAAATGVRWLVVDIGATVAVTDDALAMLVDAGRSLRARSAELIVAGGPGDAAERLAAFDVAHRPVQADSVDQVIVLLRQLGAGVRGARPVPRARRRVESLMLPRIQPRA